MTQLSQLIYTALASLFSGGLWAGRAGDKPAVPYGVYTYFGPTDSYLSGVTGLQNRELQIDAYSDSTAGAETLADTVEAALAAYFNGVDASPTTFSATPISRELAPPDPDTGHKRVMLRYSVWFRPNM